ncbi:hypothetical protein EV360DRAFT_67948 [Lentinula raphanica]|nr:hypothetical protein EV360DRAFT_67948 [Lentinula raphanica]
MSTLPSFQRFGESQCTKTIGKKSPNRRKRAGILLAAMSTLHTYVGAVPATSTVTLFGINVPTSSSSANPLEPPSTPTPATSYSLVGTMTINGEVMTVYGEDLVASEYVQGDLVTVDGSPSATFSTLTYSTPQTDHSKNQFDTANLKENMFAVGSNALEYAYTYEELAVQPVIVVDCGFDSETGACTEKMWFSGASTRTTAWTGSVTPIATFEVSVSASTPTTGGSSANAAGSLKPAVTQPSGYGSYWCRVLRASCKDRDLVEFRVKKAQENRKLVPTAFYRERHPYKTVMNTNTAEFPVQMPRFRIP